MARKGSYKITTKFTAICGICQRKLLDKRSGNQAVASSKRYCCAECDLAGSNKEKWPVWTGPVEKIIAEEPKSTEAPNA